MGALQSSIPFGDRNPNKVPKVMALVTCRRSWQEIPDRSKNCLPLSLLRWGELRNWGEIQVWLSGAQLAGRRCGFNHHHRHKSLSYIVTIPHHTDLSETPHAHCCPSSFPSEKGFTSSQTSSPASSLYMWLTCWGIARLWLVSRGSDQPFRDVRRQFP